MGAGMGDCVLGGWATWVGAGGPKQTNTSDKPRFDLTHKTTISGNTNQTLMNSYIVTFPLLFHSKADEIVW